MRLESEAAGSREAMFGRVRLPEGHAVNRARVAVCAGRAEDMGMKAGRGSIVCRGIIALALVWAALLLAGCGYRFAGGAESVSPDLRTVFVDIFRNQTAEAHADTIFRSAFIGRFVEEGRFKLARSRGEADVVCRGTVRNLQAAPLAYKSTNLSAEDRISVTLEIVFEERESGRIVWSNRAFTGTVEYPVTTVGVTEASRKNALTKLANDTAERAYRLMMSGF